MNMSLLSPIYFATADWVVQLGPLDANGKYSYSIVTDNFSASLFVLARDPQIFAAKFNAEVLAFLSASGFTSIVNKPLPVPQQGCAPF
jgi:hypothetical protein